MKICKKKNRVESDSPPDISKKARIVCILQLCIAFSVLIWILGAPFTEALYENKKTMKELEWVTSEHRELFETLPTDQQTKILNIQESVQNGMKESFQQKLAKSIEGLFLGIPVTKLVWLILSLILPILVMKQVEGAREVYWLLPILAIVYVWQLMPLKPPISSYPAESYLESTYMKEPLTGSMEMQKEKLEAAWKAYIITEWSKAPENALNSEKFANGMYHFIVQKSLTEWEQPSPNPGPWTLMCYVVWNLFAAYSVRKY